MGKLFKECEKYDSIPDLHKGVERLNNKGSIYFRGQNNKKWSLIPSIGREYEFGEKKQ
ncbi:MAG: hypothetical protein ABH844_07620 [Candidatus Omnitrophota bacterium]